MDATEILAERFNVELKPGMGWQNVMDAIEDQKDALLERAITAEQRAARAIHQLRSRIAQLEAGQRGTERRDAGDSGAELILQSVCEQLGISDPKCAPPAVACLQMLVEADCEKAAAREAALLDMLRAVQAEVVSLRLAAAEGQS